jgi:hypothetical protein
MGALEGSRKRQSQGSVEEEGAAAVARLVSGCRRYTQEYEDVDPSSPLLVVEGADTVRARRMGGGRVDPHLVALAVELKN